MGGRFRRLELRTTPPAADTLTISAAGGRTAADVLRAANEEYRWGRFEPALRLYTRALQEERTLVPAWVGQVQMLVQLGEYHEARVWSDRALDLFRNQGELLAAKAQACARLGDRDGALAASDAALAAPGGAPWRWIARGEVLLARGQRFVEECFNKALAEPGADWFDRVVIGRIYLHYEKFTAALRALQAALELQPAHGYVWFTLGECEAALGLDAAARARFARALEQRPDYAPAREALAALEGEVRWSWLRGLWRRWSGR